MFFTHLNFKKTAKRKYNSQLVRGFTLLELMIYLALFSVIGGIFVNSLIIITRVQVRETSETEVGSQANFVMSTIQRLIRESSAIVTKNNANCGSAPFVDEFDSIGNAKPCLVLRMKAASEDPTIIFMTTTGLNNGRIKIQKGGGAIEDLITDKVKKATPANSLTFTKYSTPGAHDSVEINLTLNYADQNNPSAVLAKSLRSVIARVSAAQFDNGLIPGGGSRDIGSIGNPWTNLYTTAITTSGPDATINGNLTVTSNITLNGQLNDAGNYNGTDRGYKAIIAPVGQSCQAVCENHLGAGACIGGYKLTAVSPGPVVCGVNTDIRLCSCQ